MDIYNKKISGFLGSGLVHILDSNGFDFYIFNFPEPKKFNLPKGKYTLVSGTIQRLPKPIKYRLDKLPKKEYFFREHPKKFKLIAKPNQAKASINYAERYLIIDPSLLKADQLFMDFILAHELGHRYYHNEFSADKFAKNYLLRNGYNPSQLIKAPHAVLSEFTEKRKQSLLKFSHNARKRN